MNPKLRMLLAVTALVLLATACPAPDGIPRAFVMSDPDLDMAWVVTADQEDACGAPEVAGGAVAGEATFGELGRLAVEMSAAWDVGAANPNPSAAAYEPDSPHAAGPTAPVLTGGDYPHEFLSNPVTGACDGTETATGELTLTSADGSTVTGLVTGGETHRLDVADGQEGDGIETFVDVAFDGGDGRFFGADGFAVLHLITHFDFATMAFVIDEIEVLEAGMIRY